VANNFAWMVQKHYTSVWETGRNDAPQQIGFKSLPGYTLLWQTCLCFFSPETVKFQRSCLKYTTPWSEEWPHHPSKRTLLTLKDITLLKFIISQFLLMTNLTHFFQCVYFTPLHVSSNMCSSSGGSNCVNTSSGVIHSSGWLSCVPVVNDIAGCDKPVYRGFGVIFIFGYLCTHLC
jgi:hypothetical protein